MRVIYIVKEIVRTVTKEPPKVLPRQPAPERKSDPELISGEAIAILGAIIAVGTLFIWMASRVNEGRSLTEAASTPGDWGFMCLYVVGHIIGYIGMMFGDKLF